MTTPITKPHALAKFKAPLFAAFGFFAAVGVLSVTHLGPAQAQSPGVNLAALVARLSADETTIADQQVQITFLKNHPTPGPKGDPGAPGTKRGRECLT